MTFAESLTDQERRRARMMAYASAGCGCISEVMMDSSAVILIYVAMLKGNDAMALFTTSIGVCTMLLLIPCTALISRIGYRKSVNIACFTGCFGYLLMAAAPFFGSGLSRGIVLTGSTLYALQRPLYGAAWYPLLDQFLRAEDRGNFFGTMRCIYMLLSCVIFFLIGLLMKRISSVWLLQSVIGFTGLLILGRCYFMSKFPKDPQSLAETPDFRKAFGVSVRNSPLTGYSVYACVFTLAYTSLFPLVLLYLKSYICLPYGQVQLISTVGIAGSITGFFLYGKLLRRSSLKIMELSVHSVMMLMAFTLFFYGKTMPGFLSVVCASAFVIMFCQSCFICNNSAEMLALARPGNKLMATAFCQTYGSFGGAVGRTVSSFLIGSAMIAPVWTSESGIVFSKFQTLFLVCGCLFAFLLVLIPLMPSVITSHDDYYKP